MSPYRVLASQSKSMPLGYHDNQPTAEVYAAMLSTNKNSGLKSIYILFKPYPLGFDVCDAKKIAHKMSTQNNSQIVGHYIVEEVENHSRDTRYRLVWSERSIAADGHSEYHRYHLDDLQYTLHDCLVYAMHDYLGKNQLNIITEL